MASEKLKKWIKQKREEGISDERIKKTLENTGYDPSIVDDLDNPFDGNNSDKEPAEDLFNTNNQDSDNPDTSTGEDDETQSIEESEEDFSEPESSSDQESDSKSSGVSLPSPPRFNFSPRFSVSRKKLILVFGLIMVVAGSAGLYSLISSNENTSFNLEVPDFLSNSNVESSTDIQKLADLDAENLGCPNVGVRLESVSSSNGVTKADVLVTRNKAEVVLEVKKNGEVIGFSVEELKGNSEMTVDIVGDQAKLRPLGCDKVYSQKDY